MAEKKKGLIKFIASNAALISLYDADGEPAPSTYTSTVFTVGTCKDGYSKAPIFGAVIPLMFP